MRLRIEKLVTLALVLAGLLLSLVNLYAFLYFYNGQPDHAPLYIRLARPLMITGGFFALLALCLNYRRWAVSIVIMQILVFYSVTLLA